MYTIHKIERTYFTNLFPIYESISYIELLLFTKTKKLFAGLVFWYHNKDMLKYDDDRNVKIETRSEPSGHVRSQLTIHGAQPSHSGNYTCWPTLAKAKTVAVNVVLQGNIYSLVNASKAVKDEASRCVR